MIPGIALALAGCHHQTTAQPAAKAGPRVLRALWRDGHDTLLVALPMRPGDHPRGDCGQALLIDGTTGKVRALDPAEAARRQASMQLVGAVEGDCPATGAFRVNR